MTNFKEGHSWDPCFVINDVDLPTGYYFGFTATTGDLAGLLDISIFIHSLLSFLPFSLFVLLLLCLILPPSLPPSLHSSLSSPCVIFFQTIMISFQSKFMMLKAKTQYQPNKITRIIKMTMEQPLK